MKTAKIIYTTSMIVQAWVWIFLSVTFFLTKEYNIFIFVLMVLNGIFFFGLGLISAEKRLFKVGIICFILINLILTVTDQIGFFDYLVLVLNITSLSAFIVYLRELRKDNT